MSFKVESIAKTKIVWHLMFVFALLMALASGVLVPKDTNTASAADLNLTRELPTVVGRGQTFDVKITFTATADSFNLIGLNDTAPTGWTVAADANWCTPAASDSAPPKPPPSMSPTNKTEYVWYSLYNEETPFTAVYKVTVPIGAALGNYTFIGGVLGYQIGSGSQTTEIIGGQSTITVVDATTTPHLVFTTHPSTTKPAGEKFDVQPTVKSYKPNGDLNTAFNGDVTVAFTFTQSTWTSGAILSAVLPSTTTVTAVAGVAVFSNLYTETAANGYTLTATAPDMLFGTSNPFNVVANSVAKVRIETAADGTGTNVAAQSVASGSSVTGYAITRDTYGNFVANVVGTWSLVSKLGGVVDGDLSTINGGKGATFTGNGLGSAKIRVVYGSYTRDSDKITVVTLHHITVTPSSLRIVVNGTQTFTARGYGDATADIPINNLTFTWSCTNPTAGSIVSSTGVFTAGTTAGNYSNVIAATSGVVTGNASVTIVTIAELDDITVTPSNPLVMINGTQTFTAKGFDLLDNDINGLTFTWSCTNPSAGSIVSSTGVFTAGTTAGTYTDVIRATSGTKTGIASVTVVPDPLHHITITPSNPSIVVNGTQTFIAQGYDQYNNAFSGLTYAWSCLNATAGSIVSSTGVFTAGTSAGTYTDLIQAISGGITGKASVTVTPGALHHITVTPSNPSVLVKGTQTFTAQGYDQYNNAISGLTYAWSVDPTQSAAGSINSLTGVFTAGTTLGLFTDAIRATSGGITGKTSVTIVELAVSTAAATVITTSSATMNGSLDNLGGYDPVNVFFEYWTNPSQKTTTGSQVKHAISTFSANLTGLIPNTTYYFIAKATAGAGTIISNGDQLSFQTVILSATLSGLPATITNSTSTNITVGGSWVTSYKYKLDSGSYGPETAVATHITLSSLTNGSHTLKVIGKDSAGNWQSDDSATTVTWTVDTVAPQVTGLSNDNTSTKSKTWNWASNETGSTFRYAIDKNATWTPTGTYNTTATATQASGDGTYYIHVQAKDTAGNESAVYTVQAILDNTAPSVTGLSNNDSPTKSKTWTWASSETGTTFRYAIDQNDSWTPAGTYSTTTTATQASGDGTYYIHVQAKDTAGNESAVYTVHAILDNTAPEVTGLSNDDTPTKSKTWNWAYNEASTFRYVVDQNATWVPTGTYNTTSTATQASGSGTYYIHVQAKDTAGNETVVYTVHAVLDNTAPVVTGLSNDDTPTKSKTWNWASNDTGATFRYAIDKNVTWTPTGTYNTTATATQTSGDGTYYIHVQAKDTAGNESAVYTVQAILDNTAPSVTGLSNNDSPTKSKTWTWASSETGITFRYAIDQNGSWTPAGTYSTTATATLASGDGTYYIHVQAKDTAGNESAVYTVHAILDNTAPEVTGLSNDDTPTKSKTWNWSFSASGATFRYIIDNNETGTPTGTYSTTTTATQASGNGTYYIHVQCKDTAGNESMVYTVHAILDNTAPVVTGLSNDDTPTKSKTWNWASNETGTTFRYAIDKNVTWTPTGTYNTTATATQASGDGTYYIHVQAKDTAGNESAVYTVQAILDNTAPSVTGLSNNDSPTKSKTWTWASSETGATFRYAIDKNATWTPTGTYDIIATATQASGDGTYYIHVQAKDTAGNESAVYTVHAILDNTAPTVSIESPSNDLITKTATQTVTGTVVHDTAIITTATLVVNGVSQSITVTSGGFSQPVTLLEGNNTILVSATDAVGNIGSTPIITVTLDTTAPVITIISPVSGAVVNTASITVTGNIDDPNVTIATMVLNGTPQMISVTSRIFSQVVSLLEGDNTIAVSAADALVNEGTSLTVTITRDTTKPMVSITSPSNGYRTKFSSLDVLSTATSLNEIASMKLYLNGGTGEDMTLTAGVYTATITLSTGSSGDNTIEVIATDVESNKGSSGVFHVTLDTKAPTITIGLGTPGASVLITVSTDEALQSLPTVKVKLSSDTTWSDVNVTPAAVNTWTGTAGTLAAGSYNVSVTGTDLAGNESSATATFGKTTDSFVDGVSKSISPSDTVNLNITTSSDVVGAEISVVQYSENPDPNASSGTETGIFVDIVASDALKNNLESVVIKVYYNPADLAPGIVESTLALYLWSETNGKWELVPGSGVGIDTIGHYIFGTVDHLSTYGGFVKIPPTLTTTSPATNITTSGATLSGNLASLGDYTTFSVSFEWGTASGNLDHNSSAQSVTGTGAFTSSISSLLSNTTYYFRAKVTADGVSFFGDQLSFTTLRESSGGGGGGSIPPTKAPTPKPTATPAVVIIDIGGTVSSPQINSGGVLQQTVSGTSADGEIIIVIPAGTTVLTAAGTPPTSMSITSNPNPPAPPTDSNIIGMAYNFEPSGITFNPAITLVWNYDPATLPKGVDEANLKVAFYNTTTGSWEILTGVVDVVNHTITVQVYHFTTFAAIAQLPAATPISTVTPTPTPKPTLTPTPTPAPKTPTPVPTSVPTDNENDDGGMPWWGWLLIVLGVVAVVGIVGFWFKSHRTTKK